MTTLRHIFSLIFTLFVLNLSAQVSVQDFNNNALPPGWITITQAGFDFVNVFGGEANMFKQSNGDEKLLIGTESLDLSSYTKLEVDLYAFNLNFTSDTKPDIHFGVLTNPSDINSFQAFHVEHVTNETAQTYEVYIGGLTGQGHLCLMMIGEKSQITYLDNWKLYDDDFQQNTPLAVSNLSATPGPMGSNQVTLDWTSPSIDVDGDPLSELTSVEFYSNGVLIHSYDSPTIGAVESETFSIPFGGYYKFEVIPVNSSGEGNSAFTTTQWIGLDFPSEPINIQISNDEADVNLTWTPPTTGANGAFFDGVINSYTVTRSDGAFYSIPGDVTNFSETLDILGTVDYTITANNSSGVGLPATSPAIHYDSDAYLLYEDVWVDVVQSPNDPPSGNDFTWTTSTTNAQAYWTHFSSSLAGSDPGEFSLLWSNSSSGNDVVRLMSPIINTTGLPAVIVEYIHYNDWNAGAQPYQFVLETSSDGLTWNVVNEWTISGPMNEDVIKSIANSDVGSSTFQIALTMKGNSASPSFVRIDDMRIYYQPSTDIAVASFSAPATIEPGNIIGLSAEIVNNSTSMVGCVAKCEIKERFGAAVVYENEIQVNSMNVGEILNLGFGDWTAQEGEYVIEISVQNDDDEDASNDIVQQNLNVFQLQNRSHVVIEEFTGTWCAYCPGAALGIEDLYNMGRPVAAIAYHRNDPYETPEVQERMDVYGVWGFPWVVFDGLVDVTGGDQTSSVVDLYIPVMNIREAIGSPVGIDFYYNNLTGNTYDVTVDVSSATVIQNPNLELVAVVTESEIAEDWLGLSKVDYVDRYFASSSISLGNQFDRKSFEFTIDAAVNLDHTELIVFVQDTESGEIWNGNVIDVNSLVDTKEAIYRPDFTVYPNPVSDDLYVKFDLQQRPNDFSIQLLDGMGRVILNKEIQDAENEQFIKFEASDLPQGIYFVQMNFDGQVAMKKVNIVR